MIYFKFVSAKIKKNLTSVKKIAEKYVDLRKIA